MAKYTWENMRNNPGEMDKFIHLVDKIDDLISSYHDDRLGLYLDDLNWAKKHPTSPEARKKFEHGMEILGDRLGFYKENYKEIYRDAIQKLTALDGYQKLESELTLAKPGTLGYHVESVKSMVLDKYYLNGDLAAPGAVSLFYKLAGIYELAKGNKDWKTLRIDIPFEDKNSTAMKIGDEFEAHASGYFMPMKGTATVREDSLRLAKLIAEDTNGVKVSELLYRAYIQDASKRMQEFLEPGGKLFYPQPYKRPNEKKWNSMTLEEREKDRQNWEASEEKRTATNAAEYVANVMACRAVSKLKPEKGKTFWDAGRIGENCYDTMMKITPDLVANVPREELGRAMIASKDGSALERFMRQHYIGRDTALPEDLPDSLRPTAKERIEELQRRIKSKETDAEQKRRYAVEIIAVREAVNAQRGGAGLDAKLPNDIQERAEKIQKNMNEMFHNDRITNPDKEFDKLLLADATSGHGGKMTENYYKYYGLHINKQSMLDDLPEHLDDKLMPTAKNRVEAMQARLRIAEERYDGKLLDEEIAKSVAGILAARENVNAQRGGKGLDKKLSNAEALAERTKELAEKLSVLDSETLGMLRDQALSGHGGEMKKTFESDAIQNKIMKGMEARAGEKERKAEQVRKDKQDKAIEEGMKKSLDERGRTRMVALAEYNTTLAKKQQNLQKAKTPVEQETCMSEVLYLNILKNRMDDPATLRTEMMPDKEKKIDRVKQGAEKLRGTATYQKFFKKLMSKEALKEAKNGNFEMLTGEWEEAEKKEKVFAQKMKEQQEKLNGVTPKTREQGMAGILYLNGMLEKHGPAKQDLWMKPETMDPAVTAIQNSKVFKDRFAQAVSEKAIQEAKNGKIEKMVSEWDDAALKEAQSIRKTFEKTKPEIKRTKTFQGKGIVFS